MGKDDDLMTFDCGLSDVQHDIAAARGRESLFRLLGLLFLIDALLIAAHFSGQAVGRPICGIGPIVSQRCSRLTCCFGRRPDRNTKRLGVDIRALT